MPEDRLYFLEIWSRVGLQSFVCILYIYVWSVLQYMSQVFIIFLPFPVCCFKKWTGGPNFKWNEGENERISLPTRVFLCNTNIHFMQTGTVSHTWL